MTPALESSRPRILYPESARFLLTVENDGDRPLVWSPLLLKARGKGKETIVRFDSDPPPIPPGETARVSLTWRLEEHPLDPGDYEFAVSFEEGSESRPTPVQLLPSTPKNLSLHSRQGAVYYGAWVNLASDPPQIVRSRFVPPEVTESQVLATAASHARPLISNPPDWVAWVDADRLHFVHAPSATVGQISLSERNAHLVGITTDEDKVVAVLRMESQVLSAVLRPGEGRIETQRTLPGGRILWMHGPAYLQAEGRGMGLFSGKEPIRIAGWEGELVAADANRYGRMVRGSILLRREAKLSRVDWQWDAGGSFQVLRELELGWPIGEPIVRAHLRVAGPGVAVAFLQKETGAWVLYDRSLRPVSEELRFTNPPEIVVPGGFEPLLICPQVGTGFRFCSPQGRPLVELRE